MEKAYDIKDLVDRLVARGLNVAEEQVEGLLDDVVGWATDSAKLSATPLDDMVIGVLTPFVAVVKKTIDFNKDGV